MRILSRLLWSMVGASLFGATARAEPFNPAGLEQVSFEGHKCTGFFETPSWRCEYISIPTYLLRAKDSRAVVLITHGAAGLDSRHLEYAKALSDAGINAVVVDHWGARRLTDVWLNYDAARKAGGDAPNMVLDLLAVATHMKEMPEWKDAKFGHIGESMGGVADLNLTRPYLRRAYAGLYGRQPVQWNALVSLYPGCAERNTQERFLPYPLLFIVGEEDDVTPWKDCERQVDWMAARGGSAQLISLPGQVHDFDRREFWRRTPQENPYKCANLRDGDRFVLAVNGKEYPGTPDGYARMRQDCINMSPRSGFSGNKGDWHTGYKEWTRFFVGELLN